MVNEIYEAISATNPGSWYGIVMRCKELLATTGNPAPLMDRRARDVGGVMLGAALLGVRNSQWTPHDNQEDWNKTLDRARKLGQNLLPFHDVATEIVQSKALAEADAEAEADAVINRLSEKHHNDNPPVAPHEFEEIMSQLHSELPRNWRQRIMDVVNGVPEAAALEIG